LNSDEKIQLIFEKIGEAVQSFSFLGKGEASTVMKVSTDKGIYALKTALFPERKEKILKEAQFRSYFIENGLTCIPQPIFVDDKIFPNGAVIYEYADGSKPDSFTKVNLKQFAQIVADIHKIKYEIIEDGFSQVRRLYQFLDKITIRIRTKHSHLMNSSIEEAFDLAKEEFNQYIDEKGDISTIGINAQLHGDLSDNFVIDQQGKIWLLDWENSEYGDVTEELCWFLYVNKVSTTDRIFFFREYQERFTPAQKIDFKELAWFYYSVTPVLNICWGTDQLDTNIKENLEPERKLRDLAKSARNWKEFYSDKASTLITDGIEELTKTLQ
jgi:aminoglycoside phosphotransferase (APT) family kinase protein